MRNRYYIVEVSTRRVLGFAQTKLSAIQRAKSFDETVDIEFENRVIARVSGGKVLVPKKKLG